MDGDQALEDDGPCGIAEAVCEGAKDFADASFAGMGSDEDVLDILCLWRGILRRGACVSIPSTGRRTRREARGLRARYAESRAGRCMQEVIRTTHLDLGCALDGLFERARHCASY